jgi:hypothetical protein
MTGTNQQAWKRGNPTLKKRENKVKKKCKNLGIGLHNSNSGHTLLQ